MAAPTHYLKKRDLLHGPKVSASVLSAAGREYLSRQAYSDALDFFEKARDREGLEQIKAVALKNGDSFLLARLERFDQTLVTQTDWEQSERAATSRGVESMATCARRKLAPPAEEQTVHAPAPGELPLEEA